uniref:Dispatched RND transporter family member 3 n=1 Tax=Theropithecus gelada TaxID=9565 RepID=A0A8D2FMB4_THEGE
MSRYLKNLLEQDHVQGQILLPDLLRLPALGELPPAAAAGLPRGLSPAPGLPDLRALEADLHGNRRGAERPVRPGAIPTHLRGRGGRVHHPHPAPAARAPQHLGHRMPGGDHHVLEWLGDGRRGSHLAVHPRWLLRGLLRPPGGGLPAGWREPAPAPGRGRPNAAPVAYAGGRAARGRGHRLQCPHHGHRHSAPLLLHHRPVCQVRQDRGTQHRRVHPLHTDRQHRPAGHHGARLLHPDPDFLPQGPGGRAAGGGPGAGCLPRAPAERLQ